MTDYKTNIIKKIRSELQGNTELCVKALDVIHKYQVREEYDSGNVLYRNNMGFTPADADFLTSLCHYKQDHHGRLTEKQTACCVRLMPKYARQIFDHLVTVGKIRTTATSKYHVNYNLLWNNFGEAFQLPCPETQDAQIDEDTAADEAYAKETWYETMADDANYFNIERFLGEASGY